MPEQTPETQPGQPASPSVWNASNLLTVTRIVLVPLFGWLLLRQGGDDDGSRVLAFFAFGIAVLTDRLDGDLARKHGWVTDFGKIADPIADKALTGMAFIGLSMLGELPWWVTIAVLIRELGITVLRFAVIRRGIIPASRGGKVKTVLQTVALGLYILPLSSAWDPIEITAMAVAVVVTIATGVDYVASAVRRGKGSGQT